MVDAREAKELREMIFRNLARLNNEQLYELMGGINQITCEYGWEKHLGDTRLIKELWDWSYTHKN